MRWTDFGINLFICEGGGEVLREVWEYTNSNNKPIVASIVFRSVWSTDVNSCTHFVPEQDSPDPRQPEQVVHDQGRGHGFSDARQYGQLKDDYFEFLQHRRVQADAGRHQQHSERHFPAT